MGGPWGGIYALTGFSSGSNNSIAASACNLRRLDARSLVSKASNPPKRVRLPNASLVELRAAVIARKTARLLYQGRLVTAEPHGLGRQARGRSYCVKCFIRRAGSGGPSFTP